MDIFGGQIFHKKPAAAEVQNRRFIHTVNYWYLRGNRQESCFAQTLIFCIILYLF